MGINILKIKHSFTLIEVVIVLGILTLILPLVFSMIFTVLHQQAKIYHLSNVKREGDYVLAVMSDVIKGQAVGLRHGSGACSTGWSDISSLAEICSENEPSYPASFTATGADTGSDFCFEDKYGKLFNFYMDSTTTPKKIASASASINGAVDLTSPAVSVSNFAISCSRPTLFSNASVTISFQVTSQTTGSTRAEDSASLDYKTTIKLRNF